ncbi:MAG: hypothetical protein OXB84_05225, partial [Halobacteriovoraceae bacterium]|nr:hypothetical protein [Halobacteriovoraceae bacterium]
MKASISAIIVFLSSTVFASQVKVVCPEWQDCTAVKEKIITDLSFLQGREEEISFLKSMALNFSFSRFKILGMVLPDGNHLYKLMITEKPKYKAINLSIKDSNKIDYLKKITNIEAGDYVDHREIKRSIVEIKKSLEEQGYVNVSISHNLTGPQNEPILNILVKYDYITIISDVVIKGDQDKIPKYIKSNLLQHKGRELNKIDLNIQIEQIKRQFFLEGFYQSNIDLEFKDGDLPGNKIVLLNILLDEKINMDFRGNRNISKDVFLKAIRETVSNEGKKINDEMLRDTIAKIYKEKGIYGGRVFIRKETGVYGNKIKFVNFYISIREGKKIKVTKLDFYGISQKNTEELKTLFYKKATLLSSRDYLDNDYLKEFSNVIRQYLLKNGYILSAVQEPKITINTTKNTAHVYYEINEGQQCIVSDIELSDIPSETAEVIIKNMRNKVDSPINIVDMEADLDKALETVQESGYFFARIADTSSEKLVSYQENYTKAKISLKFDIGHKIAFSSLIVNGNKHTKSVVVERENTLKRGDLITPGELKKLQRRISALGIFSYVRITPYLTNFHQSEIKEANLLVQVREKEFGSGEIIPGFRTDLGAKFAFKVAYKNLWGKNHAIALNSRLNRRFSLSELDERRRKSGRHRIEGLLSLNYIWPYLTNFFDGDIGLSFQ